MDYEHLYPGAARHFLPHVDEMLHMHDGNLTEDGLARMTNDVIRRSNMSGDPHRSQNQSMLNDFVRLLILQRAIEQGFFPIMPFPPFFVWPTFPSHRPPNRFPPRR